MKYYLLTMKFDWGEWNIPALEVMDEEAFNQWKENRQSINIYQKEKRNLELYRDFTGRDFIKNGIVQVVRISQQFYKIFNENDLSGMSMSDIFINNLEEELSEEEDDYDPEPESQ